VHLSDEFYLLADAPFPAAADYEDFPQVDNGIGLTTALAEAWSDDLDAVLERGAGPVVPLTLLTGRLAARAFDRALLSVLQRPGLPAIEVVPVDNEFYGASVTVAGLLSGGDVRRALADLPAEPTRTILLPPRMFNSDGLTLDDMERADIAAGQPHRLLSPDEDEGLVDFWCGIG